MTGSTYILGIHDGHNSGATLICDGSIVASVNEERLSRRKNEVGYPERSIAEVLRIGGIDGNDLKEVVYASLFMHKSDYLSDLEPWYRVGLSDQRAAEARPKGYQNVIFETRKQERIDQVCLQLGVPADRVDFVEHHLAHLAAAYYTAPRRSKNRSYLGLTCDGAGDGLCATVSVCEGNRIERLATTDRHSSLGKIYSRVTFLMGMTPWEHEYKLMGLAPYADAEYADRAADVFRNMLRLRVDGLGFERTGELSMNYCYEHLRDSFERTRFDIIAGAAQVFTEEMLVDWVRSCISKTGIRDLVCGGGVFMNVKANMLIAQLPELRSIYVMPSAADESLSIGCALHKYYQSTGGIDHTASVLKDLYLGGEASLTEEKSAVETARSQAQLEVCEPQDMNGTISELLAQGEIVASCRGRMEWGARALGNRSILSSAEDYRRVDKINQAIKMRDFWMPFAPSIRSDAAERYFSDPKNQKPWFMTFSFPTKPDTYDHLVAGSHPRDRSIRPQVVTREGNADYYDVISGFEERTGRGVVLNTSFNLHGEPIVNSPSEAIDVLCRSGLEVLALNNFLLQKPASAKV